MRAKYRVAVSLSGRTNNFENKNEDGYFLFTYYGNVRTTEKSAIAAVKRICSLLAKGLFILTKNRARFQRLTF